MTVADTQTEVPLQGFTGEVLERLGDWIVEVEQCDARRAFARIDPARVVEIPSTLRRRTEGTSKMRVVSASLGHLGTLCRLLWARIVS